MNLPKDPNKIESHNLLIAAYDIDNFMGFAKSINSSIELFKVLNDLTIITLDNINSTQGKLIKIIGDSALIVYAEEMIDQGVKTLYQLKQDMETYFKDKGFNNKVSFALHYGEVAIGYMGKDSNRTIDVISSAVNTAFMMLHKPFRNRFTITPQVFRKLNSNTRKMFHKFTPPIVYTAE